MFFLDPLTAAAELGRCPERSYRRATSDWSMALCGRGDTLTDRDWAQVPHATRGRLGELWIEPSWHASRVVGFAGDGGGATPVSYAAVRHAHHRLSGELALLLAYVVEPGARGRGAGTTTAAVAVLHALSMLERTSAAAGPPSIVLAEVRLGNQASMALAHRLGLAPLHPGVGGVLVLGTDADACAEACRARLDDAGFMWEIPQDEVVGDEHSAPEASRAAPRP